MKNTILLLCAIVLASCSANKPENVLCDSLAQPIFDRFVDIAEENDLKIDYTQVQSISFLPLNWGMQGVYNQKTKTITLNIDYMLPKVIYEQLNVTQRQKMVHDGILYILAHEIGHSQGLPHLEVGTPELMAENDAVMYWLIVEKGVDQIICEAFENN